jgi:hypothetical protein
MNKIKLLTYTLLFSFLFLNYVICGTLQDIQKQFQESPKEIKNDTIYDIQDIYKSKVKDYIWEKGSGNRILFAINVKFKIRLKEENITLPHLCVYLFDKEKNIVKKIEDFFYLNSTGVTKSGTTNSFKGNQTYVLQFPYSIENKFFYIVAVVGDNETCSYSALPKNITLEDFEFEEKYLIKS